MLVLVAKLSSSLSLSLNSDSSRRSKSDLFVSWRKKFSGKHIVFIAQRRILPKPTRKTRIKNKQKRPRSRTLTAVHDNILEDLVFPAEIVGKRTRVKLDCSRIIKIHLDKAQQNNVGHKTDTYSAVYKKLTVKTLSSSFPAEFK
uniref:40S ribosomal protein S7 n=1 Tax=Phallusia mammillata TaxID=59560 RepID=A0A6F9DRW5_9ASCI|nr:40S ribosomal protein S7 [Phallusia mammillata]